MQAMGRLRQPGTCTVFTTANALIAITKGDNAHASQMASLLLENRSSAALKSALSELLDESITRDRAVIVHKLPQFRFDVFVRHCQGLHMKIAEFAHERVCTYCSIVGKDSDHTNSTCSAAKGLCNKCYTPGHNRCQPWC